MREPFCILSVLGDVLDDGELQFVEAARTLKDARRRIEALAKLSPGQYTIYNGQTGECMPIISSAKPRSLYAKARFGKHTRRTI
jgi:hypothetical protein